MGKYTESRLLLQMCSFLFTISATWRSIVGVDWALRAFLAFSIVCSSFGLRLFASSYRILIFVFSVSFVHARRSSKHYHGSYSLCLLYKHFFFFNFLGPISERHRRKKDVVRRSLSASPLCSILTRSKRVAEKQQSKVLLLYRLYTSSYFSHSRAVSVNGFSLCRLGPEEAGEGGVGCCVE